MRTTEILLFAPFLKTSKFIPACIYIYILSLDKTGSPQIIQIRQLKDITNYTERTREVDQRFYRKKELKHMDYTDRSRVAKHVLYDRTRVATHGLHR